MIHAEYGFKKNFHNFPTKYSLLLLDYKKVQDDSNNW